MFTSGNMIFPGFTHSAFALGYEAGICKSPIDGNLVPPGALVKFVQKGIQYLELEANLSSVRIFLCGSVFLNWCLPINCETSAGLI